MPAQQWAYAVADLGLFARVQINLERQVLEGHIAGQVVEHLHLQRTGVIVVQAQPHVAPAPQR